jgi:hypothetical protein
MARIERDLSVQVLSPAMRPMRIFRQSWKRGIATLVGDHWGIE